MAVSSRLWFVAPWGCALWGRALWGRALWGRALWGRALWGCALWGCALWGCAGGPGPAGPAGLDYRVRVDAALTTLEVRLCLEGPRPPSLRPAEGHGAILRWARAAGRALPVERGVMDLRGLGVARCVDYAVDLVAAAHASGHAADGPPHVAAWVSWPTLWLWRPPRVPVGVRARLRFELPPGVIASTPWPRDAAGRYHLDWRAFNHRGRVAVGRLKTHLVRVAGARLEVAAVGLPLSAPWPAVEAWLRRAAEGVAAVHGSFPVPRVQVLLVGQPGDSVAFGAANRGGGPGVMLRVGQATSEADLRADWTATHELFHVGMPHVPAGQAWFSEGITTYYTYVAMTRAGTLSERAGWEALREGFGRGLRTGGGAALGQASRDMRRTFAYWRVYWGGAAWALRADVALRRRGRSLDEVVRFWRRWCQQEGPAWRVPALLRRADRALALDGLLSGLTERLLERPFPDLSAAYGYLGVVGVDPVHVRLRDEAPGAAARRAIMAGE